MAILTNHFPVSCPKSWNMKFACRNYIGFLLLFGFLDCIKSQIVNQNVDRTLDLSSQLVKESIKIVAADSTGKSFREYTFVIPQYERSKLAFISGKDASKKDIPMREQSKDGQVQFTFVFPSVLPTQTITIETVLTNHITPHPEEIRQSERQLVKYSGLLYFYSPYKTNSQKTQVKLSSTNIISSTQVKPYTVTSNKIKYGPYEDIAEFSNQTLVLHYENHAPFMIVTQLERTIEVSHWGNIAIKENIYISHSGAKLKGSFSRYELQKDGRSGQSAVKSYKTILPASSSGVYYRDSNGNISTSNMHVMRESVELELRPRFPLFGGWKTNYILGYNVPSFEYLYNNNQNYLLKMRVIDHIYDDMVIEDALVKVILPEGATNIELVSPYPVKRNPNELCHTYLDTVGRPVITFSKTNLVENHISDFQLKYSFSKVLLLQEPLLVVSFIFIIFILTIIFMRLDFSISPHAHKE